MKQEKVYTCESHGCEKPAVRGCYCQEHWDSMPKYPEGKEDENVPEENTGDFPW